MQWQFTVFSMVPLLVFVAARRLTGLEWALRAAVVTAAVEFIYNSAALGLLEPFSGLSFVLFAVLGGWSYRRGELRYFQLQPVVLECVVAAIFLFYMFVLDTPLFAVLVEDYIGLLEWLAPWRRGYFENYVITMSKSIPFVLLLHAGATAYAACRLSFAHWLYVRVLGFYAMLLILFYGERLFGAAY